MPGYSSPHAWIFILREHSQQFHWYLRMLSHKSSYPPTFIFGQNRQQFHWREGIFSDDLSHLFILNSTGVLQAKVPLPGRGAMPVPTIADVNRDGTLDIVVSLKNGEDGVRSALVYRVPGSSTNCLPWPTGRGNYLRNGYFKAR